MIWTTAKSTEVSSPQIALPMRVASPGTGRAAGRPAASVVMGGLLGVRVRSGDAGTRLARGPMVPRGPSGALAGSRARFLAARCHSTATGGANSRLGQFRAQIPPSAVLTRESGRTTATDGVTRAAPLGRSVTRRIPPPWAVSRNRGLGRTAEPTRDVRHDAVEPANFPGRRPFRGALTGKANSATFGAPDLLREAIWGSAQANQADGLRRSPPEEDLGHGPPTGSPTGSSA
jgi:hypothetical protein